jgi:hypothetical protein
LPPIVPLMPDILLISATNRFLKDGKNTAFILTHGPDCCLEAVTFVKNWQ